jgi:tetratricopeptide (TPR) repeat protein
MIFRLLSFTFFISISTVSLASYTEKSNVTPPDTTTNILDKSTAILMMEEGKRMFSEGKVRDALTQFRQVALKDPNSWRPVYWVGVCHYSLSNFGFALKYGKDAIAKDSKEVDNEVYELLGKAYHHLGELDSAIINYEKAIKKLSPSRVKELNINHKIEQCKFAKDLIASGEKLKRVHISGEINTGSNEYGPILSQDGKTMYFTSRRNDTKGGKSNPDDQEFFEDIYRATWNEETQKWDSITNHVDRINTDGFDSFSHLSADGLSALMTINNTAVKRKNATKSSDIFEIVFSNKGKWSTPKRIENPTINSTYFDGAATLTADGNTMYFVSDRKGEKKSLDIYVAHKKGKTWGDAIPLSDSINTSGAETTPFISADGRFLFFSSDGHKGMGGYDVFVSENLGDSWSKPVNLGITVNSVNNDTHFKYYPELKKAVMAGFEIVGQKSSVDMYEIDMSNFEYPVFGEIK